MMATGMQCKLNWQNKSCSTNRLDREWRKINPNNQGPMTFLRDKMRTGAGDDIRRAQILSFAYDSHSINRNE